MSYSARMQKNHLYSVLLAPRGAIRMADVGAQIAQMYLSPYDNLIGVIGEAGSGKSMLLKGMFPGLELTNDDSGVNVRPLPIMDLDDTGFFKPHTYHLDIRFEQGFYQLGDLAEAIEAALKLNRRVIVEHFDLIYPVLKRNAHLLLGVGEEIIITRPSVFGPEPQEVADIVMPSVIFRKMAHSAEDLVEHELSLMGIGRFDHDDVRHGFILSFENKPEIDIPALEAKVKEKIAANLPISYKDDYHITIGDIVHYCTGPRMHVEATGDIKHFTLHPEFIKESITGRYQLVGIVGFQYDSQLSDLNQIIP
ncbi:MAG: alanine-tRNA synthetase second additional domain-containing protein [Eubacteriales bacterium]|nr:alanine-tRNA synthetase second additional domain-containing protein [Eubacteriales bacterium]